jgi:hypothetical protein
MAMILLVVAAPVGAAGAAKRMAVMSTESASAKDAPVQAKIVRALKQKKIHVVPSAEVRRVVKKAGVPGSDSDWAALARALKVDGIVGYALKGAGLNRGVDLVLRNGADGSVAGDDSTTTRALGRRVGGFIAASLAAKKTESSAYDTLVSGKPAEGQTVAANEKLPSPTEEKAAETKPPGVAANKAWGGAAVDTAAAAHQPTEPPPMEQPLDRGGAEVVATRRAAEPAFGGAAGKLSVYELEVDAREVRRTFDYSPGSIPQRYTLNFNPMVGGRASWYPIRNAGIFVQGEFGAGLDTGSYPTGTRELQGGAQLRVPMWFGQVRASASYFHHAFLIQDTSAPNDPSRLTLPIPNTVYQGARVSAGARVKVARRVNVTVDVAYRLVASIGQDLGQVKSTAFFPMASNPWGLDGNAYLSVGLGSYFEARAGVDYRRYSYGTLRGTTAGGTAIDATGAVDQYFAGSLGLAAVLDGNYLFSK